MHALIVSLLAVLSLPAAAQLSLGGGAGYNEVPYPVGIGVDWRSPADFAVPHLFSTRVPAPLVTTELLRPQPFDFSRAKPHLAFFCRLELDIEQATHFPVRFRLGEVRTWQQELTKRD